MNQLSKRMMLAGLLATAGFATMAQTPAAPPAPQAGQAAPAAPQRMGHGDPAKMQARMAQHRAKHAAELKAKLKLTPAQEGAWTSFTTAMQPPARMGADRARMRAEFEKLATPERIDKMRAMRTARAAEMDKRADATKTFYAALTPEQQKVFDANTMRRGHEGHKGWHGGHHERN